VILVLRVAPIGVTRVLWRDLRRRGVRGGRRILGVLAAFAAATARSLAAAVRLITVAVSVAFPGVGAVVFLTVGLVFAGIRTGPFFLAASYVSGVFAASPAGMRFSAGRRLFLVRAGLGLVGGAVARRIVGVLVTGVARSQRRISKRYGRAGTTR